MSSLFRLIGKQLLSQDFRILGVNEHAIEQLDAIKNYERSGFAGIIYLLAPYSPARKKITEMFDMTANMMGARLEELVNTHRLYLELPRSHQCLADTEGRWGIGYSFPSRNPTGVDKGANRPRSRRNGRESGQPRECLV